MPHPWRRIGGFLARRQWVFIVLFGVVMAGAAFTRWWAAPLSAGPDVSQFWAFARMFEKHGLDFYEYASASDGFYPFKYWAYVYPPLWLLLLRGSLFFAPDSFASDYFASAQWRLAMKSPIIAADLAIGGLIWWAVPGSKAKKTLFASLWLLHPTAWYNSAVFGQFDAVAAAFVVAAVVLLIKQRYWAAFLVAGIGITIKQHVLIPIAGMLAAGLYRFRFRQLAGYGLIAAMPFVALSIPFVMTGNLVEYGRAVFLPAQAADYQFPLEFSFGGTGAVLTHLHNVWEWNTAFLFEWVAGATVLAEIAVLVVCYRRKVHPLQAALASFLVFIALFYRINYQYLVIYIPLALLVAATTPYRLERALALALAILPAAWIWLFDITLWFVYLEPARSQAELFERIGIGERPEMDILVYVGFAAGLMLLSLAYVVLAVTRWSSCAKATEDESSSQGMVD